MTSKSSSLRGLAALYIACIAVVSAGVWHTGFRQGLDQIARRGEAGLSLAADRLTAELRHHAEVAVLTAGHPALAGLHDGGDRAAADALLLDVGDKTSALTMLYVDDRGRVLAASGPNTPEDLPGSPYFRRAMQGALGSGHGVSKTFGVRAWFFAAPTFDATGKVRGALILGVDIDRLEENWRGDRPAIYFVAGDGQVFISNRSELLFWRQPQGEMGLETPAGDRPRRVTVGAHEVWWIDWSPYVPRRALHLSQDLPVIGLRAEALIDTGPALRMALWQAAAVAALMATFGALLYLAGARRRALSQANARLESRVAARTAQLSQTNTALRHEVSERQEAEAALKRAQADLVQAGKLSALGQMSAGISHELNQPLMAIQQYAENARAFLDRDRPETARENLGRIAAMAARMARIIKNLRAFARNESEPMGKVDIVAVIDSAIELAEPRLKQGGVTLDWQRPEGPVWVWGGEVRLGQVFVNLISNAADAMEDAPRRALTIALTEGTRPVVTVRDTGPGIADPDRIFDPFYSTKQVGGPDGMGLGLSISYGLVQSFGGTIRGSNAPEGGAVFSVELDQWTGGEKEEAA
ncbi:ATP-binding protein [Marinovum sp.]|uniref:ATP-binding protein n=1 Tax=Marinovum sp. TaxID=2024839 RepID=UPI003A8F1B41